MSEIAPWLILATIGLIGSAICSGMETGLYALNRARLRLRAEQQGGWLTGMLNAEVARPDRAIGALLLGNNAFNYIGVLGVTAILERQGFNEWMLIVINAAVATPLLLVFGESFPKELFRGSADRLMVGTVLVLRTLRFAGTITGVLPLVLALARVVGRATGLPPEPNLGERQQIAAMLKQALGEAAHEAHMDLVDGALDFRHATVRHEMIPWAEVATVRADWSRPQLIDFLRKHPARRFPVVDPDGRVVGLLDHLGVFLEPHRPVTELVQPVMFLSPAAPVREGLIQLDQTGARLAVVGSSARPLGIVTAKDLVEPLLGELAAW